MRIRAILAAAVLVPAMARGQSATPDPLRESVRAFRVAHESAIVRELAGLLAIPNVASDSANIRRNADHIVGLLRAHGITARILENGAHPPAVYGEILSPGATRTVVAYAHYDGQPVDPRQWTSPPWSPTLRVNDVVVALPEERAHVDPEARLYARSAGDDKASIIAMLAALDALRAAGRTPSVNVKLLFEGEEEAGSTHLPEILARNHALLAGDVLLFGDGPTHQSGRQQLLFGVRGIDQLELTVYGPTRALHSGHYGNWAPNPAAMLATLIASMRDDDGHIKIAGYYDDVRPVSDAERRAIAAAPAVDAELRRSLGLAHTEANDAPVAERIMLPALNVRGIMAGAVGAGAANVISTEARASFDFRLVPDETPARIRQLVNAHIARQGYFVTSDSVTMAMRLAHAKIAHVSWDTAGYPASRTAMDTPLADALVHAVRDGAGTQPVVMPTMGGSGPNYMFEQALKIPVIIVPIANYDDNQHAANENLRIGNLWTGIDVYAAIFARLGDYWHSPPSTGSHPARTGQ